MRTSARFMSSLTAWGCFGPASPLAACACAGMCLLASEWRRAVGISEHRMEGSGKVVGEGTAVVFLRHGYKAGESNKQQQEQLKGKSCPEDPEEEGSAHPC